MTDEEFLIAIGRLAFQARDAKGKNRVDATKEMGLSYRAVSAFEAGASAGIPNRSTLIALEHYYGWRQGALKEAWDNRRTLTPSTLTLESLLPEPEAHEVGLLKAAHLTDAELMAEMSFRFLMRDRRDHGE